MFKPRTISVAVDKIARQAVGKDWSLYAALLDHWSEIVGTEYARLVLPVKITFPPRQTEARRKDGVLLIRLPKGLAMEFGFRTEQIKQRIANFFGYEAIAKIAYEPIYHIPAVKPKPVEVDPQEVTDLCESAKTIDDEDLRNALEGFGASLLKSGKGCKKS
jgi:hypothetical protein